MESKEDIKRKELLRRLSITKQKKAETIKEDIEFLKKYYYKKFGEYPTNIEVVC